MDAPLNSNIVERLEDETTLGDLAAELRLVTDVMDVAITRCSRDLRYVWVNPKYAAWLGRPIERIVGHSIEDVVGREAFRELLPKFERVLVGESVSYEEEVPFDGIGRRWISASYVPTFDPEGVPDGWVAAIWDITDRKRAEETRRQSDERFRAFVLASSDVVYRMSPDWTEMQSLHGREFIADTSEPNRNWIDKYIHPDDQQEVLKVIHEAIHDKKPFQLEHRVQRVDGTWGWTFSRAVPVLNEKGEIVEWFGTAADVTRRKVAEERLREQKADLEILLQNIPGAVWIAHDETCTVITGNKAASDLLGLPEGVNVSATSFPVKHFDSSGRELMPHELPMQRAAASGKTVENSELQLELPSGRTIWIRGNSAPLFRSDGRVRGVVSCFADVTRAKQFELALQQSEQRLRELMDELESRVAERTAELAESVAQARYQAELLDAANDAIFVRDRHARISYWNKGAERLYGWTKEEAIGKSTRQLLHTVFPSAFEEIAKESKGGGWEGELIHTTRDGRHLTVASRWTPLNDAQGNTVGWLTINTDISARKKIEESIRLLGARLLRIQDEERRRIARELHDSAGQSLAALAMNLDQLAMSVSGDPKQVELLRDCGQLVQDTLKEVRTVSHLLHPPLLDETGLTSALAWYAQGFEKRSGIRTTLDMPSDFGRLSPDAEIALFRVVQESLTNVHRHSGSNTAIIRLQRTSTEVRLEVVDEGSGIARQPSESTNQPSMGVGLRGMLERIAQLGGELQVQSGERGTVVTAALPLTATHIFAAAAQEVA